MRILRASLVAGCAVPFIYFGTILVCAWLTPDESHVDRYASELGMAGAVSPCRHLSIDPYQGRERAWRCSRSSRTPPTRRISRSRPSSRKENATADAGATPKRVRT